MLGFRWIPQDRGTYTSMAIGCDAGTNSGTVNEDTVAGLTTRNFLRDSVRNIVIIDRRLVRTSAVLNQKRCFRLKKRLQHFFCVKPTVIAAEGNHGLCALLLNLRVIGDYQLDS
jgi:hypothetical protein